MKAVGNVAGWINSPIKMIARKGGEQKATAGAAQNANGVIESFANRPAIFDEQPYGGN